MASDASLPPTASEPPSAPPAFSFHLPAAAPPDVDANEAEDERDDFRQINKERMETVCSILCTELDPRSIVKWPAYFAHSVAMACQVLGTARNITFADVVSGLVNGCLLFTFAAVFSSAIFGDLGLGQYVALGMGCNLVCIIILQSAFTLYSDAGVNVVGPDFNPAIFLASMAEIIKKHMQDKARAAAAGSGGKLSAAAKDGATGALGVDPESLLSTVLAMIMIASATFGVFMYLLGRLKISRAIQLVPGSVLAGFMACIGYLVALKAIKTTMTHHMYDEGPGNPMFWAFLLPSLPIGILMYAQRRYNYGNPVVFLPIILVTPLALFFIIVYASGSNIEQARADGWLFESFSSEMFYSQLVKSYGQSQLVDWDAIAAAAPTMVIMMIIVAIEAILKQATTRKLLKAHDMRIDHELMLIGKSNIICSFFAGVVGYPQPKLTFIAYGIVHNTTSRVGGMIIVVFNASFFFAGFPLVNYLPRFWLAGILFFAAAGFLVENLLDSFRYYSFKEFLCIWAIVIVNAILGLLWAVIVGIVLAALIFALAYSRSGAIKAIFTGSEFRSSVYRSRQEEAKLNHLGSRVMCIQLHHYIFFGSAAHASEVLTGLIKEQDKFPEARRASHFIFDWHGVENIDMTALAVFSELVQKLVKRCKVIFTGLSPKLRRKLALQNVIQLLHDPAVRALVGKSKNTREDAAAGITGAQRRCFDTLDRGMEFAEDDLLRWSAVVRRRWFYYPALQEFYIQAEYWNSKHSFDLILSELLGAEMDKFFEPVRVNQGWTVCKAGEFNHTLYIVTEGSLTVVIERNEQQQQRNRGRRHRARTPSTTRLQTLRPGAFVNEDSLYEQFTVPYTVRADVDSVVLALTRERMNQLERSFPQVAIEIHRRVLNHSTRSRRKIVSMLHSLKLWDQEFASVPSPSNQQQQQRIDNAPAASSSSLETESPSEAAAAAATGAQESAFDVEAQRGESISSPRIAPMTASSAASPSMTANNLMHSMLESAFQLPGTMAAQAASLVSWEREDESDSLLDTTQIRDGQGEAEGRHFAQRLLRKRTSVPTQPVFHAFDTVRAFRAQKAHQEEEDTGEAAARAIYQAMLALEVNYVSGEGEKVQHCLPPFLVQDAKAAFTKFALITETGAHLPRKRLDAALSRVGLLGSKHVEEADSVSRDEFIRIVCELNSPANLLTPEMMTRLRVFFDSARNGRSAVLSKDTLTTALAAYKDATSLAIGRFVNAWGGIGLTFAQLCSAMAHHLRMRELDFQVEQAWRDLNSSGSHGDYVHTEDVAAKLGLDLVQAQEMVWEADLDQTDALSLFELLETLSYNHVSLEEEEKMTAIT